MILYHDPVERNVYISENEGKSWKKIPAVEGRAVLLVEHPFDNRMVRHHWPSCYKQSLISKDRLFQAFILTEGKKHYRTSDRGKLWQSFEVDIDLSLTRNPLSFHADKTKGGMILYQGTKCKTSFPWGKDCEDQVRTSLSIDLE